MWDHDGCARQAAHNRMKCLLLCTLPSSSQLAYGHQFCGRELRLVTARIIADSEVQGHLERMLVFMSIAMSCM